MAQPSILRLQGDIDKEALATRVGQFDIAAALRRHWAIRRRWTILQTRDLRYDTLRL